MKNFKKVAAAFFLMIGLAILLLGTSDLVSSEKDKEDKDGALAAIVIFGLPSTVIGGWFVRSLHQQHQLQFKELLRHKEQIFLQLLEQEDQPITIISFARAAQISLEESKQYLDQQALKLNADFDTTEDGGIIYKFPK